METLNELFYQVVRVFFQGDVHQNSIQYFNDFQEAQKRYYNIIAADLGSDENTYNAAYIIDKFGRILKSEIFDRRDFPPEPEPQPEPEPETETAGEE